MKKYLCGDRALPKNLSVRTGGQYYPPAKPAAEALKVHSQFLPGSLAVRRDLNPAIFLLWLSYL